MCAPKTGKVNNICVYCGSTNHISGRCTNRPNDNREEPRTTPRELQETEHKIQVKMVFSFKIETLITKPGLMRDTTDNIH